MLSNALSACAVISKYISIYMILIENNCFFNQGAQWLGVNAPLCKITSEVGKIFTLVSCVKGQLIEVNEALIENPNLMLEKVMSFTFYWT